MVSLLTTTQDSIENSVIVFSCINILVENCRGHLLQQIRTGITYKGNVHVRVPSIANQKVFKNTCICGPSIWTCSELLLYYMIA